MPGPPIKIEKLQNLQIPVRTDHHWINLSPPTNVNRDYVPLNAGMSVLDLITTPRNTEHGEWLALLLHNLIDRISVFYDFVTLFCNDGSRTINLDQPLFYASDMSFAHVDEASRRFITITRPHCSGRVKVADNECFIHDAHLVADFPEAGEVLSRIPDKVADFRRTGLGASTYIITMIEKLKALRMNALHFPRRVEQNLSERFIELAKYMMFHFCTIMSHITTCHFEELCSVNLQRHLFTLNLWIFLLGAQYGALPTTTQLSSEFALLCRFLWMKDSEIERPPMSLSILPFGREESAEAAADALESPSNIFLHLIDADPEEAASASAGPSRRRVHSPRSDATHPIKKRRRDL